MGVGKFSSSNILGVVNFINANTPTATRTKSKTTIPIIKTSFFLDFGGGGVSAVCGCSTGTGCGVTTVAVCGVVWKVCEISSGVIPYYFTLQ